MTAEYLCVLDKKAKLKQDISKICQFYNDY